MTLQIRAAQPSDAAACGNVMHQAFHTLANRHGFPADFPTPEAATGLAANLISNPKVFGVVAERDGAVVGSNFLSEGDMIRGVGPITVDPEAQGSGIGRRLMEAVLQRANGAAGVRLLQDGFNMSTIALYSSLGFKVREPVVVLTGSPSGNIPEDVSVRAMRSEDVEACDNLYTTVHGISRRTELSQALNSLAPMVAEREGRITAYLTAPSLWLANHGVAESDDDMRALIAGTAKQHGKISFLLPTRQTALFNWCLRQGLRVIKPMTLMTKGEYRDAESPYMPSVFY